MDVDVSCLWSMQYLASRRQPNFLLFYFAALFFLKSGRIVILKDRLMSDIWVFLILCLQKGRLSISQSSSPSSRSLLGYGVAVAQVLTESRTCLPFSSLQPQLRIHTRTQHSSPIGRETKC